MKLFGKIIFLCLTIYLLIPFLICLNGKVQRPNFKNLSNKEFVIFGIILIIMIGINIKLFLKKAEQKNN